MRRTLTLSLFEGSLVPSAFHTRVRSCPELYKIRTHATLCSRLRRIVSALSPQHRTRKLVGACSACPLLDPASGTALLLHAETLLVRTLLPQRDRSHNIRKYLAPRVDSPYTLLDPTTPSLCAICTSKMSTPLPSPPPLVIKTRQRFICPGKWHVPCESHAPSSRPQSN